MAPVVVKRAGTIVAISCTMLAATAATAVRPGRSLLWEPRRRTLRVAARADSPSRSPASGAAPSPRQPRQRRPAGPIPAASTLAPLAPNDVVEKKAPQLPKPWERMSQAERADYLEAVREYHGRGVVLEFFDVDGSGRAVQALVEPEMVRVWRDYSWSEHPVEGLVGTRRGRQPDGFTNPDSMYSSARQQPGCCNEDDEDDEDEVVQLHVLTAERIHVGGELPDFVDVLCADGCPANCLVDNLTLKPWTADATASGEWLQFRARLEERWQWMQLEERYEKLSAEQAQRERRALLMQAARQRLEAGTGGAAPGDSELAAAAEPDGAAVSPAAGPAPTDHMSDDEMEELITSFFADPKGRAQQLMQATTSSSSSAEEAAVAAQWEEEEEWEDEEDEVDMITAILASSSGAAAPPLLAQPAPQLQLCASSSASADGSSSSSRNVSELLTEEAAAPAEQEAGASSRAPQLPRPWRDMGVDERRSYLEAVRDYQGQGVLCERVLRSGRTVFALVDPAMRAHWQAHTWRDSASSGGRLFTETAPHAPPGARTYLTQWTAELVVLGRCSLPLHIVRLEHKDGCPANCLASNLELELRAVPAQGQPDGDDVASGSSSSEPGPAGGVIVSAAAAPAVAVSNNILPAAPAAASVGAQLPLLNATGLRLAPPRTAVPPPQRQLDAAPEAAPGAGQLRAAKLEARHALRAVYDWLGAEQGRQFFAQLHEEYLAAEQEQRLLEERREALAVAAAAAEAAEAAEAEAEQAAQAEAQPSVINA
ncbi:hypothetical protein ABPG77_004259 [Micractinium sp. CCAP 211/92]